MPAAIGLTAFPLAVTVRQKWHNDMFIEKLWIIEKVAVAVGTSQPMTKKQTPPPKKIHGQEISDLNAPAWALLV